MRTHGSDMVTTSDSLSPHRVNLTDMSGIQSLLTSAPAIYVQLGWPYLWNGSSAPLGFPGGSNIKNPPAKQELQEMWG